MTDRKFDRRCTELTRHLAGPNLEELTALDVGRLYPVAEKIAIAEYLSEQHRLGSAQVSARDVELANSLARHALAGLNRSAP